MGVPGEGIKTNLSINGTHFEYDLEEFYRYLLSTMCSAREDYIVRMVIFALFIFFGIIGNVTLLFVILKDKHLRNSPNILICNLALADMMFIVIVGPLRIEHEIHPCWLLGRHACALRNYAPVVCQCACVYSLVALSRERYSAIICGIQGHVAKQVKITVGWTIITWVFGIIFAAPILSEQFSFIWMGVSCMSSKHGELSAKIYEFCRIFILYIIPLIIISVHYIIMAKALIQSTKNFQKNSSQFIKQVNARKRLAYLSITLSIFFGFLWLPSYIFSLMYHFSTPEDLENTFFVRFRHFHYYMSLANSSFNPWLVFILSSSHRNKLQSCFGCGKVAKSIAGFRSGVGSPVTSASNIVTSHLLVNNNRRIEHVERSSTC